MRCHKCEKIKLRDSIPNVVEYAETIRQLEDLVNAGDLEVTYQTCPFDKVFGFDNKFFSPRMFHQVRCTRCGQVYGLFCDTRLGDAQLKMNHKVFDPNDYPDLSPAKKEQS